MQTPDKFATCQSDTLAILQSTIRRVQEVISKQGNYLLPRQLDEFNKGLSRLGLVLLPSCEIVDYASDIYKTEEVSRPTINLKSIESLDIDKSILDRATVFNMSLSNMSLNQILKPSIAGGEELIYNSAIQTVAQLPKTKGITTSIYDSAISSSIYRFLVGGDDINAVYKYGKPTPKEFKSLDEYAYSLSLNTVSNVRGRSM